MRFVFILAICQTVMLISYLLAYYFLELRPAEKKSQKILNSQKIIMPYEIFQTV